MELSRRHFLALGLTAVSGAAALGAAGELSRRAGGPGVADLARIVAEPELWSAEQIGRAWLRANPAESSRAELERLLAPLPDAARSATSLRDPAVRKWLQRRQQEDFEANRIVQLEGWWLGETEARFCAFLAMA